MSSFICDPKHFNSIENALNEFYYKGFYFPYSLKSAFPKIYEKRYYSVDTFEAEIKKVVNTLRELNVLCVMLQYKDHYVGTLDKEIDSQLMIVKQRGKGQGLNLYELLKALKCVRYQIETEHLQGLRGLTGEEENAMFFLNEMINAIAMEIVTSLEAYENSKWRIE